MHISKIYYDTKQKLRIVIYRFYEMHNKDGEVKNNTVYGDKKNTGFNSNIIR